ncbi:hypothetical protein HPB49_021469 [Dermacentor silvarum]|uniref:Uncharacterized protein n=1 Tax=Dermacentor silvarum TaxID=543639 RepID=A0ACB8D875_DERSI|nr:hypothetical protein HPB49_021469 [Dermacentor silvarum]
MYDFQFRYGLSPEKTNIVYSVEGDDIDPAELNDGTWQHPRGSSDPLDLQKRFGRKKADPPKNAEGANSEGATTPTKRKARPPRLPRRRPMPRLPEDDYKIVLRPKCAVDLANIGLVTLLDAIHSTSKIDVEQADQVRVHPIKNTITISTPDRQRADAYRTITELRNEKYNVDMPVAAYVPAPDDSIRGVVYRAYTDETDETIQSELPGAKLNHDQIIPLQAKDPRDSTGSLGILPTSTRPEAEPRQIVVQTQRCPT